jgi:hypothetical protein
VTRARPTMCRWVIGSPQRQPSHLSVRLPYLLVRNAPTVDPAFPNMNRSYTPLPVRVADVFEYRVVDVLASTVSISVLVPAVTSVELEALPSAMALAAGV